MKPYKLLLFLGICTSHILLASGDAVKEQLPNWAAAHPNQDRCVDTGGVPFPSLTGSLAVGTDGPALLGDHFLLQRTQAYNRERIPERVAHAKGVGAHGVFTVTNDISQWTKAKIFNRVGKQTPIFLRFSTTNGEMGSADTVRDSKGFAVKFYTEDGNWDITGNGIDVFGIRDPMLFPELTRSRKRNPQTHLKDPNMMWDFVQQRPETTHHLLKLFSDMSQPESLTMINGSSVHTFKLVNSRNETHFCKFLFLSHQKFTWMPNARAVKLTGSDSNYYIRDLFDRISANNFPRWTLAVQVATPEQAQKYPWNYLDITKNWRPEYFPIYPVGVFELNSNPNDFFSIVEQAAFSPGNTVPGIEPSADPMLHSRMFAYPDAQRYRLGVNFNQLPVNRPLPTVKVVSYERDGKMRFDANGDGGPNFFPNSYNGCKVDPTAAQQPYFVNADVVRVDTRDDDNFSQPKLYIERDVSPEERRRIVDNIAGSLKGVTSVKVRELVFQNNLTPVSVQFAQEVRQSLNQQLLQPAPTVAERPGSRAGEV